MCAFETLDSLWKIPRETGEDWGRRSGPHTEGQPERGVSVAAG